MSSLQEITWCIKHGDHEKVKEFIESNKLFDINIEINGRTLLHYAADYGHEPLVRYLLDHGANINKMDKHKISPLLAAIYEGHYNCVVLLLERGADKNGLGPDGRTYLESAEKEEIKQLLHCFFVQRIYIHCFTVSKFN